MTPFGWASRYSMEEDDGVDIILDISKSKLPRR